MRVVVVDDDDLARSTLAAILRRGGHEARAEGSVAAAEAAVASWSPEVVIIDRHLPDGDGLALGRSLRARTTSLRLVLLSGERVEAAEDFDAVLLKPVGPRAVLDAVAG